MYLLRQWFYYLVETHPSSYFNSHETRNITRHMSQVHSQVFARLVTQTVKYYGFLCVYCHLEYYVRCSQLSTVKISSSIYCLLFFSLRKSSICFLSMFSSLKDKNHSQLSLLTREVCSGGIWDTCK